MPDQTSQCDNETNNKCLQEEIHMLRCQLFDISFEHGADDSKKRSDRMKDQEAELEGQRRALSQWRDELFEQSKMLKRKQEMLEVFFL